MRDTKTATAAAPAISGREQPPPIVHPMDPRRGNNLSPMFAAFLCWLLQLPPTTEPAIVGVVVSSDCVFAATGDAPFHDTIIGDWHDLRRNLRAWGAACDADAATVERLIAKVRPASGHALRFLHRR